MRSESIPEPIDMPEVEQDSLELLELPDLRSEAHIIRAMIFATQAKKARLDAEGKIKRYVALRKATAEHPLDLESFHTSENTDDVQ
jgi:hypothetical protein